MAIFRCKMCGGDLVVNGESVAACEYCNTMQTLPKLDDEKRLNLYDRANHFRRNNEFDKAMKIYEQILNEDDIDAEAYWSLVLCKYGIEYVEDYSLNKRIPTINRVQYTSIFDDSNYKMALEYADSYQKSVYEDEAKVINDIQKDILLISEKEKPFDVFICYKETDNFGRRTKDSVLAQELYHGLIKEGFKVFFSRITLEDKLGSAYEPYIFAALNSSKVMVVLGTKSEYFNAVWVKNEWSRYLALIKNGSKKILIPAYRDMDPYDLPEEFSHLQAQDMSKLGFMQDLIRGIKKIVKNDNEVKIKNNLEEVIVKNNDNVSALVRRIFLFLEDEDFERADDYCERVLDMDPENEQAYLGKLMVSLEVSRKEDLAFCDEDFSNNNDYKKIVRFGSESLKEELKECINIINIRNDDKCREEIYQVGIEYMAQDYVESYRYAIDEFKKIIDYKDTNELIIECEKKIEIILKEEEEITKSEGYAFNEMIYNEAKNKLNDCWIIDDYEKVIELLEGIPNWKDSCKLINLCKQKIEELKPIEDILEEKDNVYEEAINIIRNNYTVSKYRYAGDLFRSIPNWRDSDELAVYCSDEIQKMGFSLKDLLDFLKDFFKIIVGCGVFIVIFTLLFVCLYEKNVYMDLCGIDFFPAYHYYEYYPYDFFKRKDIV